MKRLRYLAVEDLAANTNAAILSFSPATIALFSCLLQDAREVFVLDEMDTEQLDIADAWIAQAMEELTDD